MSRNLLPLQLHDKEMLDYLDKIFKLGVQLAVAAINIVALCVLAAAVLQPNNSILTQQSDFLTALSGR